MLSQRRGTWETGTRGQRDTLDQGEKVLQNLHYAQSIYVSEEGVPIRGNLRLQSSFIAGGGGSCRLRSNKKKKGEKGKEVLKGGG